MQKFNNEKKQQSASVDVFHAFLVENAEYAGIEEIPVVKTSKQLPEKVITFSKALKSQEYDAWVLFYEHDVNFVRIWNQPRRYLKILKKFKGVISPDFSLYRRMPLCMQKWSTYQGKALAHWWTENGIEVIPNVRFADERSYEFCFDGIEKNSTVAVGTHGCIKRKADKEFFKQGLAELYNRLHPRQIIVYGAAPDDIFQEYRNLGVEIIQFDAEFALAHEKEVS